MTKGILAWLGLTIIAVAAAAQTTVTTSGGTTTTVPVFTGSATVGNSPITVSGSNVGIGTTSPAASLDVNQDIHVGGVINPTTTVQGAYLGWNALTGSWGETDLINNPGLGYGGFAFMEVPVAGSPRSTLMFINGANGNVGIGTASPVTTFHINSMGNALSGYGLMLGKTSFSGNTSVAVGSETGRFEVAFPTYRDIEPNQIGAKIAAIRWNNYGANNPLVQAIDLAFFTSLGSDGGNTPYLVDTSSEKVRITAGGNVGIGTTAPGAKLEVDGNVKLTGGSGGSITFQDGTVQSTAFTGVLCGGDYADSVDVTGDRTKYDAGDLLVIDPHHPGKFLKSAEPYSTSVAGIFSTKPGTLGRRQTGPKSLDEVPMAMVGIVPTKVTAENGAIRPGDLLVTASMTGYAMKGTDRSRMLGAVVGKALGSLDSGTGVIEVVVTLQ